MCITRARISFFAKPRSHGPCFGVPFSKNALSPVVRPERIVVALGFVGWLERSGEMSVNARTSKEASRGIGASVQFLWIVVDCVCAVGMVRLIEFRLIINL
ncbi:hypothetical protein AVEN_204907-1 [Araneus ventricosus]|uniref:Uncharacterized protein n=1 Tax=Araneus ventricosus TaxID=182803 RepID=A0A4Y2L3F8_ARAVE|nr:hypothetical protein AVEN_204907-1 [Araneus ventricosus]